MFKFCLKLGRHLQRFATSVCLFKTPSLEDMLLLMKIFDRSSARTKRMRLPGALKKYISSPP